MLEAHGRKDDKAATWLEKGREVLLTFHDFPAEHGKHPRSANPVENTFVPVRRGTTKTEGCQSASKKRCGLKPPSPLLTIAR